jgi:hypothetical protein
VRPKQPSEGRLKKSSRPSSTSDPTIAGLEQAEEPELLASWAGDADLVVAAHVAAHGLPLASAGEGGRQALRPGSEVRRGERFRFARPHVRTRNSAVVEAGLTRPDAVALMREYPP